MLAALAAVVVLAAACGTSSTTTNAAGTSHVASTPVPSTLTIDDISAPATLDPALQYDSGSYDVYRNIFDQLLMRNPTTLKIEPWIATSWKTVNPTTWVFDIRSGVHFTNGELLTGKDVAFSLNRILNPALASPQYANFSDVASASGTTSTVTIHTKTPDPTLLTYLTTLSIVPEQYVKRVGNAYFNLHPIGSGPYKLVSWQQGSTVTLARNPDYWAGKPEYKEVVFRDVPSSTTRLADLESGVANIAINLSPSEAAQLKSSSTDKVISGPTEGVADLYMNSFEGPTKSLDVREAIADAVDYNAIIDDVLEGYGKPVKEVLTPDSFGYTTSVPGFKYDPSKAKALLAQSPYPHATLVFRSSPDFSSEIVDAIQANLDAVGFHVSVEETSQATFLADIQSPSHNWGNLRYGIWSCGCLDADGTLYPLFHTGSVWSSYSNPTVDHYLDAARTTINSADRKADYKKVFDILQQTVPAVGMYQAYYIDGVSDAISWNPGPQQTLFITEVHWR